MLFYMNLITALDYFFLNFLDDDGYLCHNHKYVLNSLNHLIPLQICWVGYRQVRNFYLFFISSASLTMPFKELIQFLLAAFRTWNAVFLSFSHTSRK